MPRGPQSVRIEISVENPRDAAILSQDANSRGNGPAVSAVCGTAPARSRGAVPGGRQLELGEGEGEGEPAGTGANTPGHSAAASG